MGYTTDFYGNFTIDRPLDDETYELIKGICSTRRMKRKVDVLISLGLGKEKELGVEGEFYYPKGGRMDDGPSETVENYNSPPSTQPGLWCDWEISENRSEIKWSGMEKFYNANEWMVYLIEKILAPKGYVVNGIVNAQGEDPVDQWHIRIINNLVMSQEGFHVSYIAGNYENPMEIREFEVRQLKMKEQLVRTFKIRAVECTPERVLIKMAKDECDKEKIPYEDSDIFNISLPTPEREEWY
jgi:hypothetical protein